MSKKLYRHFTTTEEYKEIEKEKKTPHLYKTYYQNKNGTWIYYRRKRKRKNGSTKK